MIDFEAVKGLFNSFPKIVNEVDDAAHSKIGEVLVNAAQEILGLVPAGAEVDEIIVGLKEVATLAHGLLQRHEVEHPGEPVTPASDAHTLLPTTVPTAAPAGASSPSEATPATDSPAAPAEAATSPESPAASPDASTAPESPEAPPAAGSTDAPSLGAPVAEATPEAAPPA